MRRLPLALVVLLVVPAQAAAYPWPVKPFHRQHPVRGNFGDLRSLRGSVDVTDDNPLSFHSGIDIQAPDGTRVYAVAPGIVSFIDAKAVAVRERGWPPPAAFSYWHIDPAVRPHKYVRKGQLIGWIRQGVGHVHLSERRLGRLVNPLRRGGIRPYADHAAPVVRGLVVYRAGTRTELPLNAVAGRVDVAVDAYDPPSLPLTAAWQHSILSPAEITWSASFGGAWFPIAASLRFVDLERWNGDPVREVYAWGTRQNAPDSPGDDRFWLIRDLDTSGLLGEQALTVAASDVRGNRTTRALRFTVVPAGS